MLCRDLPLNWFKILYTGLTLSQESANLTEVGIVLVYPVYLNHFQGRIAPMGGEMFTAAILSFGLIFVGILMGYALLKIQGDSEEAL
jgi:cytochrome b6-f complex subunit 7